MSSWTYVARISVNHGLGFKNGFTNVVIVGPQDLENNQCSVKNLVSGEQNVVDLDSTSISSVL